MEKCEEAAHRQPTFRGWFSSVEDKLGRLLFQATYRCFHFLDFQQTFELFVEDIRRAKLHFVVKDATDFSADPVVGECSVRVAEALQRIPTDDWYTLYKLVRKSRSRCLSLTDCSLLFLQLRHRRTPSLVRLYPH